MMTYEPEGLEQGVATAHETDSGGPGGMVTSDHPRPTPWIAGGAYTLMMGGTAMIVLGIVLASLAGGVVAFIGFVAALGGTALATRPPSVAPRSAEMAGEATSPRTVAKWRVVSAYPLGFLVGLACQWLLFGVFGATTRAGFLLPVFFAGLVAATLGMLVSRGTRDRHRGTLRSLVLLVARSAMCSAGVYLVFRIILLQVLDHYGR